MHIPMRRMPHTRIAQTTQMHMHIPHTHARTTHMHIPHAHPTHMHIHTYTYHTLAHSCTYTQVHKKSSSRSTTTKHLNLFIHMAIQPSSRLHLYLLPNKHLINTLMTLVNWPGMCVCVCVCVCVCSACVRACVCVCV